MKDDKAVENAYEAAKEKYLQLGVSTEQAIAELRTIALSIHCWQGDDVQGFDGTASPVSAGIQATGAYPGKARTAGELRADLAKALSLIPGRHRVNLHAMYAETDGKVQRNELTVEHFSRWVDWAAANGLGMDFNGTFFAHPKAQSGFTLASADEGIRKFWVEHGIACRRIGEQMGRRLDTACVTNIWIPDGYKDIPADRKGPRERLKRSLDEIFAEKLSRQYLLDSVEGKLFGIGSESYVAGSHEFYLAYAVKHSILLCLDMGHFHPTEVVSDKISAALAFLDRIMLHISRAVRWDSDHVAVFSDELQALAQELVRGNYLPRVHLALDFFDASISRVAAWVIGARSAIKAVLFALLEPTARLREFEANGDFTSRLALQEEIKTLPFGAVWDYYCFSSGVPLEGRWLGDVKKYDAEVTGKRNKR
jgi:L-rhamnose isomerase